MVPTLVAGLRVAVRRRTWARVLTVAVLLTGAAVHGVVPALPS
jgi:hypothetical protein